MRRNEMKLENISMLLKSVEITQTYLLKREWCTRKSNVGSPSLKLKHIKPETLYLSNHSD